MKVYGKANDDYVAFADDDSRSKKSTLAKTALTAAGLGLLAVCAFSSSASTGTGLSDLTARTLGAYGPGPGPGPAPGPGPNPVTQCASGVIALKSDLGVFLSRCRGCVNSPYEDEATIHVTDPNGSPYAQWSVVKISDNVVALRTDTGKYLARCNGCVTDGAYPDSAFVHVPDWRGAPYAQWTIETLGNGKVALKSDTGRYLARCRSCAGANNNPPDRAFVHSTTSADPWAQWDVQCLAENKLPIPSTDGSSVRCSNDPNKVYRYVGGKLRLYPNPTVAQSWDANWAQAAVYDCTNVQTGPDMTPKLPTPAGATDGTPVRCDNDPNPGKIYRYTGNQLRWYPNEVIAKSWDANFASAQTYDCSSTPNGPDMPNKYPTPAGSADGTPVRCFNDPTPGKIYRYTGNQLRWYPNEVIAKSWDTNFASAQTYDCSSTPNGPDMGVKYPPPSTEGQAVKCNDPNSAAIYRYTGGQLRLYPNPTIAASWDPAWDKPTTVDCTGVPKGPDMPRKSEWVQLPGRLTQISYDGDALCGCNKDDDIWCATDDLDTTPNWRHIPGKLVWVTKCGNRLYGTNRGQGIFSGSATGDPQWRQLPGGLKQISCDGKQICGVNSGDQIWCADTNIDTNPNWRNIPGGLKQVEVRGDKLYGVNSANQIWIGNSRGAPDWQLQSDTAKQISFDNGRLCGVRPDDTIFCVTNGWTRNMDGRLCALGPYGDDFFGVNSANEVWYKYVGGDTAICAQCPNKPLTIDMYDPTLAEGETKTITISLPPAFRNNVQSTVKITPDAGLSVSATQLHFNAAGDSVKYSIKVRVSSSVANGAQVSLKLDWTNDLCGRRTQPITFTVKKVPSCRGQSSGDPHMLSLDGVGFEYQKSGYYKLVETKGLRVDVQYYRCGANLQYTCNDGIAVRYANSVVRIFAKNNVMLASKGTPELEYLSLWQAVGNPNSYRIFITPDPSSYIDITQGIYIGRAYFDVTVVLGAYLNWNGLVGGLLGNCNGRGNDDITDPNKLAELWAVPDTDNLVVSSNGVAGLLVAPSDEDKMTVAGVPNFQQGFNQIDDENINYKAVTKALEAVDFEAAEGAVVAEEKDEKKYDTELVRAVCAKVLMTIPHCNEYVKNHYFFIDRRCVLDTVNGPDLDNIDAVKLAYLDECRRSIEDEIRRDGPKKEEAIKHREELDLANPRDCVGKCGEHGTCETNGCACNHGHTGLGCALSLFDAGLIVG